ncbi:MAG: arsenic resistance N-acetyltransferase ArsN2 [Cyclobacteriaceae bacterium]|jgi:N-acetylglutamate synthase-like GNAT family acetyltransferase
MMTIEIKPAAPPDATQLTSLGRQTFVDAFEKDNNPQDFWAYVDKAFDETTVQQELADPQSAFFMAYAQGEAVGYLKLRSSHTPDQLEGAKALEIQRIYVQQSAIGKGIGAQLLQTALRYAQANSYTTVWLGVWEHNPRAIAFYQKWGFQLFGSHRFMMGNDPQTDLLMKRDIPPLQVIPATWKDLAGISTLLQQQQLPTEDLNDRVFLLIAHDIQEQVAGACGLEVYDTSGLLRSLAVAPAYQGKGLGKQLVSCMEEAARARHITTLFLLTTTADTFFEKLGYERVDRPTVPPAIQQTTEFAHLCPSTAVVMRKELTVQ